MEGVTPWLVTCKCGNPYYYAGVWRDSRCSCGMSLWQLMIEKGVVR